MQTSPNEIKRQEIVLRGIATVLVAVAPVPSLWEVVSAAVLVAERGSPVRPAEVLTAVLAAAALALLGWLVLGVVLVLVAMVPGMVGRATGRVGEACTPHVVRTTVGVLLGVVVVAGAAPVSSVAAPVATVVTPAPPPDPGFVPLPDPGWAPQGESSARSAGGWVPGPPVVRAHPDVRVLSPAPRHGAGRASRDEIVVRRGDSLWSIAARHLGEEASDAEIARAWPAWFAANREVIGADPDLLRPGQLLRPPGVVPS